MRNTFITTLCEYAGNDTHLIVGDVGYSVIERFVEKFPDNYFNAGVAEQAMTGVAAGLALMGNKVFTYSIANFNTIRCLEQIRNDICYHKLDVTIVSVGGGFLYGSGGYSHHAVQDIAMIGSLPFMTLLLPSDAHETAFCMKYAMKNGGPKYLRLGKNGEKDIHTSVEVVEKINIISAKHIGQVHIACLCVGTIAAVAHEAIDVLSEQGVFVDLITCPIVDRDFNEAIKKILSKYTKVIVCEEHVEGFGMSAIIHHAAEGLGVRVISMGAMRDIPKVVGDQNYLREQHGLNVAVIQEKIRSILNN